jgi:ribonuclease J
MSFKRRGMFFEEYLMPRSANGMGDLLATGLIPDIHNIYREDLLKHLGRKPEKPDVQGVILSHAHADHANYISFLHQDIPIYCGETCKYILEAVEEQTQRTIECEVLSFKKRPAYKKEYKNPRTKRKFNTFRTGNKIKIDSLEIIPIHVDHSVPGAYGFIIHTSEGPIIYTGDLRMHGTHAGMTEEFIQAAKKEKPIAMITEGTRIETPKTDESEGKIYQDSKKILKENAKLSIVDFNFKDVDRFRTFYKISKDIGKKFVINFKHACFLEKYHRDKKLKAPSSTDKNILILKPKRLTGTYIDEDYQDWYIKRRLNYSNIITAEEIAKKPKNYMVVLNFWYFNQLVDLKPYNGVYIHSLSEPFNEEMEISFERMMNWLENYDMQFIQSHCSGHINGDDLKDLIKTVAPDVLYPIHTEHPEMFTKLCEKTIKVEEGRTYKI